MLIPWNTSGLRKFSPSPFPSLLLSPYVDSLLSTILSVERESRIDITCPVLSFPPSLPPSPPQISTQVHADADTDIYMYSLKNRNAWPKDKHLKVLGTWTHENISPAFYGLSVAAFTRLLGWTVEELEVFLVDVRKDFANPKIHAYFPV